MDEKKINDLKNKVVDFKRFSFILLSLCGFLSVGLILPSISLAKEGYLLVISLIVVLLVSSIFFHRSAMACERKLYSEES